MKWSVPSSFSDKLFFRSFRLTTRCLGTRSVSASSGKINRERFASGITDNLGSDCFLALLSDEEIIVARDAIVGDLINGRAWNASRDPPVAAQLDRGDSESARGKEQRKVEKKRSERPLGGMKVIGESQLAPSISFYRSIALSPSRRMSSVACARVRARARAEKISALAASRLLRNFARRRQDRLRRDFSPPLQPPDRKVRSTLLQGVSKFNDQILSARFMKIKNRKNRNKM